MKRNTVAATILVVLLLSPIALSSAGAQDTATTASGPRVSPFVLELEGGPVWQSRNDVQIPNSAAGTRFSLVDLVGSGPLPAGRLYVLWNITDRHGLRLLLAPLSYTESGQFTSPVNFAGKTFQPGVPTDATYKFNSWRITYRYNFHQGSAWNWWIGFTAKVRDAKIALQQGGTSSEKTDVGFVPLLHLAGQVRIGNAWSAILDVDALAGGPGRAEDASIKISWDLSRSLSLAAGYRTVEGGADVEEVYNFAWLHYAVVSLTYRF